MGPEALTLSPAETAFVFTVGFVFLCFLFMAWIALRFRLST